MTRKGILLAGGTGSRLWPLTLSVSKQLLPVYDKPMIYYPLTTLMLMGLREICIITSPRDQAQFRTLLGDGGQWGLDLHYIAQPSPEGLAQAYLLAEDWLAGAPSAMVLGDNLFHGVGLPALLRRAARARHATIFGYRVRDPERYGVLGFDDQARVSSITEKPRIPASPFAVTGLYLLDGSAPERARQIRPSSRGELEITSLLESYLKEDALEVQLMGRGYSWLDMGTPDALLEAGNFIRALEDRQGLQAGCPEEIAYARGWISDHALRLQADRMGRTAYGSYLRGLA